MIPDVELFLRSTADGALIATETLAAVDIGPIPHGGLSVEVAIPAAVTGTNPTLDVTVEHSVTVGGTFTLFATQIQIDDTTGPLGDGSGVYVLPINTHLGFVRVVLTITGTAISLGRSFRML